VAWNKFHRNHSRKLLELGTRLFCKSCPILKTGLHSMFWFHIQQTKYIPAYKFHSNSKTWYQNHILEFNLNLKPGSKLWLLYSDALQSKLLFAIHFILLLTDFQYCCSITANAFYSMCNPTVFNSHCFNVSEFLQSFILFI
jgi:hypothetical protein